MSAKCGYTEKYYPLLLSKWDNREEFIEFVNKHFENPETVLEKFNMNRSGAETSPTSVTPVEVKEFTFKAGVQVDKKANMAEQFYVGDSRGYRNMSQNFVKRMIEIAIFKKNEVIDPYNVTELNKKILDYKRQLLKEIADAVHVPLDENVKIDQDAHNAIFTEFEALGENMSSNSAYAAYVTLKHFDNLLQNLAPFINIAYANSSFYDARRYKYSDLSTYAFKNVMSTNEFKSAEDSSSELVKLLLQYFPKVDKYGNAIENSSITLSAFNSAMSKVKSWASTSKNERVVAELRKKSLADYGIIIDEYINHFKNIPTAHRTYLTNTLRGIKNYVYDPNLADNIKLIFTHLIEKTVPSNYVEYTISSKGTQTKFLTERTISLQRIFLKDCIDSMSEYYVKNSTLLTELMEQNQISYKDSGGFYEITINDVIIKVNKKNGETSTSGKIANINTIVEKIANLVIADDFDEIASEIYGGQKSATSLYAPIVASIIIASKSNNPLFKPNDGQLRDLGRVLSTIYGADLLNVVKNSEDNNMPLYQMMCLAYRHQDVYDKLSAEQEITGNSIYQYNEVYKNISKVMAPQIRVAAKFRNTIISSSKMSADDIMHLAIMNDFYDNLVGKHLLVDTSDQMSGIVGLQSHVYSDKNKHFIQMFDLNSWKVGENGTSNFAQVLIDYLNNETATLEDVIYTFWNASKNQIYQTRDNIVSDYKKVFGNKIKTWDDVKQYVSTHKVQDIRGAFYEYNKDKPADQKVNFVEEFHASKKSFNETLDYFINTFAELSSFKKFLYSQFDEFKKDVAKIIPDLTTELKDRNSTVNVDRLITAYFITDAFLSNEYNRMMVGNVFAHPNKTKRTQSDIERDLKEEYRKQSQNVDEVAIKNEAQSIYNRECLASRWISQVKRMVIYGATYHSYAQGLTYGVGTTIKTACIEDLESYVQSITGLSKILDAMDGSGLTSPILSRMQDVSLVDVKGGANKKTIYHDITGHLGNPVLLKWAEYAITNEKRRNSHSVSLENIYKKMHSLEIGYIEIIDLMLDNIYFERSDGKLFKITKINIFDGYGIASGYEVDSRGNAVNNDQEIAVIERSVSTIYDIDQLLGGAWAKTLDADGDLQFTENNLDILHKIVCENNLKDKFIGWLVNKSGMKVGATNLNSRNAWTDDSPLQYTELSSEFGGLQMNADHELDHAEVTEMTQMISALEQMGYSHDLVTNIYREIGNFCLDAIGRELNISKSNSADKNEQLYQIFGKAIIEAFNTGEKDTLGLAQAFCAIAKKSLHDAKLEYHIPFSSSSINGIFNSTVTSNFVKKAIRRHYDGIAAVLNPSFNIIEYYELTRHIYEKGKLVRKTQDKYRKEELRQVIQDHLVQNNATEFSGHSIDDFINKIYFDFTDTDGNIIQVLNPFIKLTPSWDLDFEDTVVLMDEIVDNNGKEVYINPIVVKLDTYEKYDIVKHYSLEGKKVFRHNLRPKNLKGSDTRFYVNINPSNPTGIRFSVFESEYTKALKYFVNSKIGSVDFNSLLDEFKTQVAKDLSQIYGAAVPTVLIDHIAQDRLNILKRVTAEYNPVVDSEGNPEYPVNVKRFKRFLLKKQQALLTAIQNGQSFYWGINSKTNQPYQITAEKFEVTAAQIGMGKLYAKQFGLKAGDSLAKIKKEGVKFFEKRIESKLQNNNFDTDSYDAVLYDGTGNALYVKVGNLNRPLVANTDYVVVEGVVYHDREELCSVEGKQFYKYTDSKGAIHDVVIIDNLERLSELKNTHNYIYYEYNYTNENYTQLMEYIHGENYEERSFENIVQLEHAINRTTNRDYQKFNKRVNELAQAQYKAFLQSLNFVGTRIPCQNQTSFAPMEVVIFSDVTENEVYVPTNIMWLEGSDLDIDKQYILGYSVSKNGTIPDSNTGNPKYKSDALKNNVVSGILNVIKSPVSQLNLTTPLTIENMEELASKSALGQTAKRMSPYNPACKYMMQIENMVGKDVIGNVATAIKSFFALSYVYNEAFDNIYKAIVSGNEQTAINILQKHTFKYKDRLITLANVNMDKIESVINQIQNNQLKNNLENLIDWQDSLDDQSEILAQLLNIATDNAKELILKKINADANWADLYTSAFILGEDLMDVGNFMISDEVTRVFNNYQSSIFDSGSTKNKLFYLKKLAKKTKNAKHIELAERAEIAEELRILGKMLKINQGMPVNFTEFWKYVHDIEHFINKKFAPITNFKEYEEYIKVNNIKSLDYPYEVYKADFITKNWPQFSLLQFISDMNYRNSWIEQYENVKTKFNILDVISKVPHFNAMYEALNLNHDVLTNLSKRNAITWEVLSKALPKTTVTHEREYVVYNPKGNLSESDRKYLNGLIDNQLIYEYITTGIVNSDGQPARIVWHGENNSVETIDFDGSFDTEKFKSFVEDTLLPALRSDKLPGVKANTDQNLFIRKLTFGKHNGTLVLKLPYNMSQIDKNQSVKVDYEAVLNDFGKLRQLEIADGITIADVFYLYNLIVYNDKFGPNSMTRIFEDLIASDGGEKLLVYKFNEWLENVNSSKIVEDVLKIWASDISQTLEFGLSSDTPSPITGNSQNQAKTIKTVNYAQGNGKEHTYTIEGKTIRNEKGEIVFANPKDGNRLKISVKLALQENRAVKVSYQNHTYIVNDDSMIYSVAQNKIVYESDTVHRRAILAEAEQEFAKLQNMAKSIDINTISNNTEAFGVVFPKQGKTSQALKSEYQQWKIDNPTGIVAYRVKFPYNTIEEVQLGHIGNPFSENARGANTVQQFYDWLVTGNNFGNEKATDEYRRAIISKLLSTPANSPILYYTELNRPSHATVLGYLIANKQLLSNQSSPSPVQFDDSIDISEESVAEEPVTIGFDNTSDRVSEESNESNYIEPIRRLQLLDDYYRPIFTSEELIAFEEDAKRIFENDFVINERVNIPYSEWKTLDDIADMRRWEKIWEDIIYEGSAEESENDFKYNNKNKTVQIPKYIYDRIKLYQKYQKLVDFLMGIAQKNNYYDYYGNLLRHDEEWFGYPGSTSLDILKDLYDLAGIKEIYDDPNQLKLFDSLHIDSDYIAEHEEILRNAHINLNPTPVYQTTPSKQSKLVELVRQANEFGIKGLHIVSNSDLINEPIEVRSALGFVRNGEIYINIDKAGDDTVIHEFGHLYLADAKVNNRDAYYALLDKIRNTELWQKMKTWRAYANKIGSDFDEEVLATMIGDYYKHRNSTFGQDYEYESLVQEALSLVNQSFIDLLNSEILPDLGDTFITNYALQQKMATIKRKLVSDNIIKENCQ